MFGLAGGEMGKGNWEGARVRVARNFIDDRPRDVPWPDGGGDSAAEEEQVGKFWAHDIAGMDRMDREMDAAAVGEVDEVERLEKQMSSDYEGFVRSGGSDRLMQLKTRGK